LAKLKGQKTGFFLENGIEIVTNTILNY